eukprot:m.45915 g.45915  ORF g.45915 m.45915 type:complete len:365 (+) comp7243_c0_seq1:201-1295(+)
MFGLLKEEILKKRQQLQDMNVLKDGKTSFKRGDLANVMEKKYREETLKESSKRRQSAGSDGFGDLDEEEEYNLPDMSMEDVHKRLRSFGQPILLFGENEIDVRRRLRDFEISDMDVIQDRQRNDLQDALLNVDAANADDVLRGENRKLREGPKYTWEELQEMGHTIGIDSTKDGKVVRRFFKFLLELWGVDLENRERFVKESVQGRRSAGVYLQTEKYLKPLFRLLKRKELPSDILQGLTNITYWSMRREYMHANDAYVLMSIGNAPWPIGVTNVGIHDRTGREKIHARNIAHVLNDEQQRKYIQGVKRLMTFCQKRFPNVPSKCLEFGGVQGGLYPVESELNLEKVQREQEAWKKVKTPHPKL